MSKYFTIEEANALLPQLKPIMGRLLEIRARVVRQRPLLGTSLQDLTSDIGGPVASQMVLDFMAIEQLVEQIQGFGCVIKDVNAGLLDFLAQHNGREVYLCWRYGEETITHYHDLHTGFAGRQRIQ